MTSRREALALFAAPAFHRQRSRLAVTIDDVNWRIADHSEHILEAVGKTQAILFAVGTNVDNVEGRAILSQWNGAGHLLGNHTYSHHVLNDPAVFEADILRNEPLLVSYSHYGKRFRFPALKEGNTRETRDRVRRFLHNNGYRSGAVTIDASDWYYDQRLRACLAENPKFDTGLFRNVYLAHVWDRANYYDQLASHVVGRRVSHTLLLHFNTINALFLKNVLTAFQARGWQIVSATDAFHDPVFERVPDTLPAGESLIWSLAKEKGVRGLRYPGEDAPYETAAIDRAISSSLR